MDGERRPVVSKTGVCPVWLALTLGKDCGFG